MEQMTATENNKKLQSKIKDILKTNNSDLETVTQVEYEETLEKNILEAQRDYETLISTYNQYLRDKERYHIKYWYSTKGYYTYTKHKKPIIGFRTGE